MYLNPKPRGIMRTELKMCILKKYGTQSNFARACGRNDNWISRLICGRQNPTAAEIELIAQKLFPALDFVNEESRDDKHTGENPHIYKEQE
jgi:transcriptional regulator with XRE-family HTH domain